MRRRGFLQFLAATVVAHPVLEAISGLPRAIPRVIAEPVVSIVDLIRRKRAEAFASLAERFEQKFWEKDLWDVPSPKTIARLDAEWTPAERERQKAFGAQYWIEPDTIEHRSAVTG